MNKFIKIISVITLLVFLRVDFALSADQVYFYYTDPAGTPMVMSDSAGSVVWRADYLPFGEETIDQATVQNNKMFVGKEKDAESGLYYFGARYMDAGAGRFASPDPVGPVEPGTGQINQVILHNPQRLNRYAYGLNNPYRYIDPDGNFVLVDDFVFWTLVGLTGLVLTARQAAIMQNEQNQNNQTRRFQSSSSESQVANGDPNRGDPDNQQKGQVGKDIEKSVKRFSKKSLRQQQSEYNSLKDTYEEHLLKYGQEAGETTGEVNRIERQLNAYRDILQQRGTQFNTNGAIIE